MTEEEIYSNLKELYKEIPENKMKLVDGLIREAARLKVSLDELWDDIQQNGNVVFDKNGNEKERPTSAIFTSRDKSYRACIRHLDSLLPVGTVPKKSDFSKLDDEDDEDDE